jgi:hypothetical protein
LPKLFFFLTVDRLVLKIFLADRKLLKEYSRFLSRTRKKLLTTPLTTATVNSCQCIYDLPYLFIALSDASQVWIIIGRLLERFAFKAIYQIFLRNERMHFLSTTSHSVLAWRWSLKSSENFFGIK